MCGILGIVNHDPIFPDMVNGLISLQHRGQDAAGITTYDKRIIVKKGPSLVKNVFDEEDSDRLTGSMGIGHTRYPTWGSHGVENAQPFVKGGIALAQNGNLTNFDELARELKEEGATLKSSSDGEVILEIIDRALSDNPSEEEVFSAIEQVLDRCKGGYACVVLIAGFGLVAFRDSYGIRPLVMGNKGKSSVCFSSESCAFTALDYTLKRDVGPGEAVIVREDGTTTTKTIANKGLHPCIFEYIYFARPDSIIDGISVYKARLWLGKLLGNRIKEMDLPIDRVVPVPDTSRVAAQAIAEVIGVKYREGLIKNRYIGRTFIMPGQKNRENIIRYKLSPNHAELEGKNILLVDDSIVRGTTSKAIIDMVKRAGAKKVFFVSACPPLRYQNIYGIDMSVKHEFVAHDKTIEEIEKIIGADKLIYQNIEDMLEAVGRFNRNIEEFEASVFTGKYPTKDITKEMLKAIEQNRLAANQAL